METNDIGSTREMKKYTNWIAWYYPYINHCAEVHDMQYETLYNMGAFIPIIKWKLKYDITFLIAGLYASLINKNRILGFTGAPIVIILFILVLLWTPMYYWRNLK